VSSAFVSVFLFSCLFLLHIPLLQLPYIWDEAGYYVPAARDLLLSGTLIPHSTVTNAHPPLVMAWVALWWKLFGYAPLVTRTAMLVIASFTLLSVFRLAQHVTNRQVAVASTMCTAIYSVFFTQSSLLHLDMAAAGFTLCGLLSYLQERRWKTVLWFSLAGLSKETAILAPVSLIIWELVSPVVERRVSVRLKPARSTVAPLAVSLLPLALWFAYHYWRTGYVFGNPEFFRYNVAATLHPLRIVLAMGMRLWQVTGYMHLLLLTLAAAFAMFCEPLHDASRERPRIAIPVQMVFLILILTYIAAMSLVGGAVLTRYMLPVLPLVIIVCVSTVWRRVRAWRAVILLVTIGFGAALFLNPPYGFSFEDNLAYRDYIQLHQRAEDFLEARYPMARVLTAWPASDELARPYLGYVTRPLRVVRIENFSYEQLASAADVRDQFDVALMFSTKYLPPHSLLARWPWWQKIQIRFFGFHRDLPPAAAAQVLGGRLVYVGSRNGQWVGVIEMEHVVEARGFK
jgi:4-amino-4-deoxy-L-arabinose transferase-like glycosyltransferase